MIRSLPLVRININVRIIYTLLTITTSCLLLNTSYAQHSTPEFDHITIKDGLSQSSVFSITEDSKGFLWFGTRGGGLNKYNGYSFIVYKHNYNDSLSICGNEIISLLDDKEGNLWVGTRNNGLSRFDLETELFHNYSYIDNDTTSLSDSTISCLYQDDNGKLWIGTNSGLCTYNKEFDNFIRISGLKSTRIGVKAIAPSLNDSLLWIGTKHGVILYNKINNKIIKKTFAKNKRNQNKEVTNITAIVEDKKGRLWVGTRDKGIFLSKNKNNREFINLINNPVDDSSITSNVIRTIHEDKNGTIWIGTKSALEQLLPKEQDARTPKFIHHGRNDNDNRSMNHNSITSFFEDSHNNFWVGTFSGGVNYLYNGPQNFEYFKNDIDNPLSLSNNVVSSFAINNNETWVGTEGGGLNLFNQETGEFKKFKQNLNDKNSLQSNHIKSLFNDHENSLWVGTFNGVFLYDRINNKFKQFLKGSTVYSITEGLNGELWIGTSNKLFKINKTNHQINTYEFIENNKKSLSNNAINKVFTDSRGRIWIATKEGLNLYNRDTDNFTSFIHCKTKSTSLSHSHITSICEDNNGDIWVGTFNGVNKLDTLNFSFDRFQQNIGMPEVIINNILFDNDGFLWTTNNNILTKLNPNNISEHNDVGTLNKGALIRSYDYSDGLQDGEFRVNASFKDANGTIYLGGVNGFNIFNPTKLKSNNNIPKVVLTELKLFNKPIKIGVPGSPLPKHLAQTTSITLNHKQSVLTINFAALNYTKPENNQYAYMMQGFDREWNYIGNKREATYTSLPKGEYTFRVKASNNDGIWNEKGTLLKITILPPWWETWWVRISIVLSIISISLGYYFKRVNNLEVQKQLLEHKVVERTSELQKAIKNLQESHEEIISQKEKIIIQKESIFQQKEKLQTQKEEIEKQAERLIIQNKELIKSNNSKDKFHSILAHDLKNPFGTLLNFLELINENIRTLNENKRIQYFHHAYTSAKVIFQLIENLLQWSKNQKGETPFKPENISIKSIVEYEILLLSGMAENKRIKLEVNDNSTNLEFVADKNMLGIVLRNLISNAIKFTAKNGLVSINIENKKDSTIFSVTDNGIGIPESRIDTIFEIDSDFSRIGTSSEKGTGMGLPLCKEFIVIHQGDIWVKSIENKGSSFFFSIPKLEISN